MSNPAFQKVGKKLLPPSLLQHGIEAQNPRNRQFQTLLEQRKWPEDPWDDITIQMFLNELTIMDSNNFFSKPSGVGEREGRIYSSLVKQRCYGLAHGVGRSGDLAESQPKAAGSSLLSSLTNDLLLDFLQTCISKDVKEAALFPMATGMTMALVLLTLSKLKPEARNVIWLRHDQKSVFKSILTAGLNPVIIDPVLEDDQLVTNIEALESTINSLGRKSILCVISTTSCFAPRACDHLKLIGKQCQLGTRAPVKEKQDLIFNVVNNAYGLQSTLIQNELKKGLAHIDLFIQSTDKNLLVPVGGCIVGSPIPPSDSLLSRVRKNYPGRASSYPASDVLITILSMGKSGWKELVQKREENYQHLKNRMNEIGRKFGEHVLSVEGNDISIGLSLKSFVDLSGEIEVVTEIGGMLFKRNVTGSRVVSGKDVKVIDGHKFIGWGAHYPKYHTPYLTAASAIGMKKQEIDHFVVKLEEALALMKASGNIRQLKIAETNNNAVQRF